MLGWVRLMDLFVLKGDLRIVASWGDWFVGSRSRQEWNAERIGLRVCSLVVILPGSLVKPGDINGPDQRYPSRARLFYALEYLV